MPQWHHGACHSRHAGHAHWASHWHATAWCRRARRRTHGNPPESLPWRVPLDRVRPLDAHRVTPRANRVVPILVTALVRKRRNMDVCSLFSKCCYLEQLSSIWRWACKISLCTPLRPAGLSKSYGLVFNGQAKLSRAPPTPYAHAFLATLLVQAPGAAPKAPYCSRILNP